jgi:hypothetical protein
MSTAQPSFRDIVNQYLNKAQAKKEEASAKLARHESGTLSKEFSFGVPSKSIVKKQAFLGRYRSPTAL